MSIAREISIDLGVFLDNPEEHSNACLVAGARQVGKTQLCREALSKLPTTQARLEVNLEVRPEIRFAIDECRNFSDFETLLASRLDFRPGNQSVLFIDEAQESKKLGAFVRFMKEQWRHTKCILTGSSMTRLFADDVRVPVGRTQSLVVRPFSFREFLRAKNLDSELGRFLEGSAETSDVVHHELLQLYDNYLRVGGLPASVMAHVNHQEFRTIQQQVFASQQDDFYRKERLKEDLFVAAMKAAATRLGFPAVLSSVSESHRDAKNVIDRLSRWHLLHQIEQTSTLPTQQFHPKWYIYDNGISSLLRMNSLPSLSILNTTDPILRTPLGGIVENSVLLNLISGKTRPLVITGWKKNRKQPIEVDFVARWVDGTRETTVPIEVKAAGSISPRDASSLVQYLSVTRQRYGMLVSLAKPKRISIGSYVIDCRPCYQELAPQCD